MKSFVSGPLRILHGPAAFTVMNYCRSCSGSAAGNFRKANQLGSDLRNFPKNPGIRSPVMIYDGSVEFLVTSAALPDLEVLHTVRTVCYGLQGGGT
jgi:hypothetical protein